MNINNFTHLVLLNHIEGTRYSGTLLSEYYPPEDPSFTVLLGINKGIISQLH